MRSRLLLAAAAAVALIGVAVVAVVLQANSGDTATPTETETLRRSAPPPAVEPPMPPPEPEGDPARGAEVFAATGCGNCHTLAAAGSTGTIGPVLDGRTPGYTRFLEQVSTGGGGMPAYEGTLSAQEIEDVVAYVISSIDP